MQSEQYEASVQAVAVDRAHDACLHRVDPFNIVGFDKGAWPQYAISEQLRRICEAGPIGWNIAAPRRSSAHCRELYRFGNDTRVQPHGTELRRQSAASPGSGRKSPNMPTIGKDYQHPTLTGS